MLRMLHFHGETFTWVSCEDIYEVFYPLVSDNVLWRFGSLIVCVDIFAWEGRSPYGWQDQIVCPISLGCGPSDIRTKTSPVINLLLVLLRHPNLLVIFY